MAEATRGASPWIRSARFDGALILAPPFVATLGAALWQWQGGGRSLLTPGAWLALVVCVDVAHVYSALFRTYLNPRLASPLRPLLWIVPLSAWGMGALLYRASSLWFWRGLAYLAVFHFVRQPYGLMRLYARREPQGSAGQWLDTAAVYAASAVPLLEWHARGDREFHWFVDGDFVSLTAWASVLPWVRGLGLGLLVAFGVKELGRARRGFRSSAWGKLGVVYGTASAWWVGIVLFNSDTVFTATNVLSHGIPYAALVWAVSQRAQSGQVLESRAAVGDPSDPRHRETTPPLERFTRAILAPRAWPFYIALLLALAIGEETLWDAWVWREHGGLFGTAWRWAGGPLRDPAWLALVVPLLAVPQATHYVLDAWVWKARWNGRTDREPQESLITEGGSQNVGDVGYQPAL